MNKDSRVRTDAYDLTNKTWNNIQWDADNGYFSEAGFKMDQTLQPYIEQSCLFVGMAGTGTSKTLLEMQRTLSNNEESKLFITACPTHKACTHVNGVALHRLFNVNPTNYSYEYKQVLTLKMRGPNTYSLMKLVRYQSKCGMV